MTGAGEVVSDSALTPREMPRLLDLFCGGGGATKGYQDAGFHVTGVDIDPQPDYCGDEFIQADAMHVLRSWDIGGTFDAVHASPPCQGETSLRALHQDREYARLLVPTLALLAPLSVPWVVENVDNADAPAGIYKVRLCGSSFGLRVRRHRWFWSNRMLLVPPCDHRSQGQPLGVYGNGGGGDMTRGRKAKRAEAREAMGIDWMTHKRLVQAIPPAYTEHIGRQLMQHLVVAA